MKRMILVVLAFALAALAACTSPGEKLFKEHCGKCHSIRRATVERKTEEQWEDTVFRMRKHGAVLTDAEAEAIVRYLSRKHGV